MVLCHDKFFWHKLKLKKMESHFLYSLYSNEGISGKSPRPGEVIGYPVCRQRWGEHGWDGASRGEAGRLKEGKLMDTVQIKIFIRNRVYFCPDKKCLQLSSRLLCHRKESMWILYLHIHIHTYVYILQIYIKSHSLYGA